MIHPQFSEAASHISAAGICDALVELVNIASPTGHEAGVACSLYLDVRTVPGQTFEAVKRDLRAVLRSFADRTGHPQPKMHVYVTDPPNVVEEHLPIVQALKAAQILVAGESAPPIIRRPGADAVHLTAYGVPCVAMGPGGRMHPQAKGASMHAFGEHVLLDCVSAARTYLALALDLCNRKA
jgi:acetylornithine deacetylase/succinyl-diaminopimelate desuccinylase-like protein